MTCAHLDDERMPDDYTRFAAIAGELFGDVVDPRELWEIRKANDPSEVHVDGDPQKKKGHSNAARLLVLGTAAEADAAVNAGTQAVRAVRSTAGAGSKAGAVGRAALQGTNLGIGLFAAHKLSSNAKQKTTVSKIRPLRVGAPVRMPTINIHRSTKVVLTPDQLKTWQAARDKAATGGAAGMGAVAGGAVAGVLAHRAGVKRGQRTAGPQQETEVAKAFRVKPLNAAQVPRVVSLKARRRPLAPPIVSKAADIGWTGVISKVDEDKRQVFGWCSLSTVDGAPVVDLQGDYVPLDEIEKSAYKYVIESRKGGDMHKRVSKFDMDEPLHTADLIESFVVTPEKLRGMGLPEDSLPHGWWVGFKVNDDTQWQMVKSGERAGFSIHGTGQRRAA